MKRSQIFIGLALTAICSQALSQQLTESSGRYEIDLGQVHGAIRAVQIIKDICNEDFPHLRARNEFLYAEWRKKRLPFLQEIERHMTSMVRAGSNGNPTTMALNGAAIESSLNTFKATQRVEMKADGPDVYESRCSSYGRLTVSPQFDIENSFAEQVATIRKKTP